MMVAKKGARQTGKITKERIIEVASRLFEENGFAATPLREITDEAHANIAAVNYHFGSKEELYAAVFSREFGPLLEKRQRLLDEIVRKAEAPKGKWDMEALLASWLDPLLEVVFSTGNGGSNILTFESQLMVLPQSVLGPIILLPYKEYGRSFRTAIANAAPYLTPQEAAWRTDILCSGVQPTLRLRESLEMSTGEVYDFSGPDEYRAHWIAAGLVLLGGKKNK